jgi:molybdopterin synthase catalytic subunit/molybdopterin converting factor small subunit
MPDILDSLTPDITQRQICQIFVRKFVALSMWILCGIIRYMRIRIRYFAALREIVGLGEEPLVVPDESRIGDVRHVLLTRYPQLQAVMERSLSAVNHRYVPIDTVLQENDELVFIPPTGGGALMQPVIRLTREPLDRDGLIDAVSSPECGGIVVFEGVVRNHARGKQVLYLEYEMYEEMAREQIQAIIHEAQQRWGVERVALAHRIGHLEIGETSVIIVVASPHRAEAFDACRYIIDTVKANVPIWKKEVATTGEEWVEG